MNKEIVLIEWLDSKGLERWEYLEDLEPLLPARCLTVGFLLDDKPDYVTIALGISDTQVLGRMTIPKGCISKIKSIEDTNV